LINQRANSHEKNKSSIDFKTAQKTVYWCKNRNQILLCLKIAQRTTLFQRSTAFLIKSLSVLFYFILFYLNFYFFIKCMQFMIITLSKRCAYVKLHVSWSKSLLYIFSLINNIDSLCKQALLIKQLLSLVLLFSRFFVFFSLYSFILNNHFLVTI